MSPSFDGTPQTGSKTKRQTFTVLLHRRPSIGESAWPRRGVFAATSLFCASRVFITRVFPSSFSLWQHNTMVIQWVVGLPRRWITCRRRSSGVLRPCKTLRNAQNEAANWTLIIKLTLRRADSVALFFSADIKSTFIWQRLYVSTITRDREVMVAVSRVRLQQPQTTAFRIVSLGLIHHMFFLCCVEKPQVFFTKVHPTYKISSYLRHEKYLEYSKKKGFPVPLNIFVFVWAKTVSIAVPPRLYLRHFLFFPSTSSTHPSNMYKRCNGRYLHIQTNLENVESRHLRLVYPPPFISQRHRLSRRQRRKIKGIEPGNEQQKKRPVFL